jgi:DNA-binding transcriptional ArsR family regulator
LFRSETQLKLLGAIFSSTEPQTMTELAQRLDAPISSVSREVGRLAAAGLIRLIGRGRSKFVEARRDYSWAPALAELLDRTVGVSAVVVDEFSKLEDVTLLAIFGSWAERRLGRLGLPPNDIDVLIVGEPSGLSVVDAAHRASGRLGLEVSPYVIAPNQWEDPGDDPVLQAIQRDALIVLVDRTAERD